MALRNDSRKPYKGCLKRHGNVAPKAEPKTAMFPLSNDKLFSALKGLQTGKSPGSDDISNELYLALWNVLGDRLIFVLNERRPWCSIRYSA